MSARLLMISTMYKGSLDAFYRNHPELSEMDYNDHYALLLNESTDFAASYVRNFRQLGIEADFVIANDLNLLKKWRSPSQKKNKNKFETIYEQIKWYRPEILWIDDFKEVDKTLIAGIRSEHQYIKLLIGYHCTNYDTGIIEKMKFTDFMLTCTPGIKLELENLGLKCFQVYHGFDTNLSRQFINTDLDPNNTFIFSGTLHQGRMGSHNDRITLLEEIIKADIGLSTFLNLESGIKIIAKQMVYFINTILSLTKLDFLRKKLLILEYIDSPVKMYSKLITDVNKQPLFGTDMYKMLASSRIVLNIHAGKAADYCGNMRMFEVTGAGSCLLTENKINLKDLFVPGVEVVAYDNSNDCIEKAKWLLEHEKERKEIAIAGQRRTLKDHTVLNRCQQILEIIEDELKKK